MTYVAAILATACFGVALGLLGVVTAARKVIATSRGAAAGIRDPALSDLEKEKMAQKASLSLMGGFLSILVRGTGAFAISLLPLFAFQAFGGIRVSAVAHLLSTWQGILLTSVVMISAYLLAARR